LRSSIPTKIEIKENIESKAMVKADPGRMHQVVMNLCTNAYQAMLERGGTLTVSLKEVEVSGKESIPQLNILPKTYLRLEIKDTGQGIEPNIFDKIFDPYFTTKDQEAGTGLGLAVVHAIVKDHNGYIEVKSNINKGSCFQIFLPVTEKRGDHQYPENSPDNLKHGTESIMIIDDEDYILNSTHDFLTDYGYHAEMFSDGTKALAMFEKRPDEFDMVITDMTMPGIQGDEIARSILSIRPDIPVILCSGYSEDYSAEKVRKIGIRKFVQKPVDFDRLIDLIRDIFDNK